MASTHGDHAAASSSVTNPEGKAEERVPPGVERGAGETSKPAGPSTARKAIDAGAAAVAQIRKLLAQAAWIVCVLAALSLVLGAALIALDANEANGAVAFVLDLAERADLGWFSRENGPFQASGENKVTKDALINWGLGAVVWLVAGKIVERIVRP